MPLGSGFSTIAHYRLDGVIGQGNMGVVYLGHDTRQDRHVAIKVLAAHRTDDLSRARFRHEAKLLSRVSHPNIATMFEFGEEHGVPYLVMELVQGKTVQELRSTAPLPGSEVVTLGVQLANGLAAAHAAGVIHRDIKPPNLCMTPEGLLKILDFGVAMAIAASSSDTTRSGESIPPTFAGTLQYMAPERLQGVAADARTDIFSAGMVLYELACKRMPYPNDEPLRLMEQILSGRLVRPRQVVPTLNRQLERVILHALEFDPDRRYQRAIELAGDLADIRLSAGRQPTGLPARAFAFVREAGRLAASMFLAESAGLRPD